MGKELVIENDNVEYAEGLGWLVRKIVYAGRRGAPDRWFFKRKKPCPHCGNALKIRVVEYKKLGEKVDPNDQQGREHGRLREHGLEVHVIDNIEDGRALFD